MWVAIAEQFYGQRSNCCLPKESKQYDSYCVLLAVYAKGFVIFCVNLSTGDNSPLHYHNRKCSL
jgi:hypothetical protein